MRLPPAGGVLLRYPPFAESRRMELDNEYPVGPETDEAGTSDWAASTKDQVEEAFAGSRMRLRDAPVELFRVGTSPVTYATPFERIAAP